MAKKKIATSPVGSRNKQLGFTLLAVLAAIVIVGLMAEVATVTTRYQVQRDKENELLFRGLAYQAAIKSYYDSGEPDKYYPRNFEELVYDSRFVHRRHIRQLYTDPITGGDWEIVQAADGGIAGVVSRSDKIPLKQAGFPKAISHFEGLQTYNEWLFEFKPPEKEDLIKKNVN